MRTFVIVAVTVIVTALVIGFSARIVRSWESNTELAAEMMALRQKVDAISGRTQALVWSEELIRKDLKSLEKAKGTVVRDNRYDFLRLLAEDRDNRAMPEIREALVLTCESAARQHGIDKHLANRCVDVFLTVQRDLFETRRRLIPPGGMLATLGPVSRITSEMQRLRSWRLSALIATGATDSEARILIEEVKDIQDLSPTAWR